jgi:hypothetical protein
MITTDGSYIYGEGHAIEPGYLLSPITVHAHSYLVAMDLQGNVISYYPTSALPPVSLGLRCVEAGSSPHRRLKVLYMCCLRRI